MVFSSLLFLFRFLPAALLLYYITPRRFKNFTLLVVSLVFYSWGEVRYLPIMIASMVIDYSCGQGIRVFGANKKLRKLFLLLSFTLTSGSCLPSSIPGSSLKTSGRSAFRRLISTRRCRSASAFTPSRR